MNEWIKEGRKEGILHKSKFKAFPPFLVWSNQYVIIIIIIIIIIIVTIIIISSIVLKKDLSTDPKYLCSSQRTALTFNEICWALFSL